MKNFKISFFLILIPSLVLSAALILLIYFYDPLQIFHKPWFRDKVTFNSNMRLQNAGIINQCEFDSLIMGNSLLENMSSAETSRWIDGGKFVNLSMSGSSVYERYIVLNYALSKKHLNTVLVLLDAGMGTGGHGAYPIDYWNVLYDADKYNDLAVYFDENFLFCTARLSNAPECIGDEKSLDRPNAWYNVPEHKNRFGGIDNWIIHHDNPQLSDFLKLELPEAAAMKVKPHIPPDSEFLERIDHFFSKYLFSLAGNHSETNFILIIPPGYRAKSAIEYKEGILLNRYAWIKQMVKMGSRFENVEVYGFEDRNFVDDIANYKDLIHFSEEISDWIIRAISVKEGLLTLDNIDEYLAACEQKAKKFDLGEMNLYVQNELSSLSQ